MRPDIVSVIIPVYNAEKTLYKSIDSLINQSYPHLELIFINDCSQDNTLNILYQYEKKIVDNSKGLVIKIISHEENRGVAAARNTGLQNATGELIYYVDADDFIDERAIELLVEKQQENDADIVGCSWYLSFNQNKRRMNQPPFNDSLEAIQQMLNGKMRWNLWLFMVKRSLYEDYNIRFIPGMNMGEDLMVIMKLFVHANKVAFVNDALYHYGQSNEDSLTKTYSEKHRREVTVNLYEVEKYLHKSSFFKSIGDGISFLKLNIKIPLLISDNKENYECWINWFPEANKFIMKNKDLPLRTRILQWLAIRKQYWILKLYYNLVIRYIYGVLYK
ncbi:glycosyltransferase family 2 protein [Elizabethkingia anophelis]|uniref:Poly-beta-1,6-N-acetyl-D-glucosamine synthase n=1 Tax=Elizabethkingia anophelis TaxID=1117645 RepID=A0A7Z7PZ85_9FLAO|nr:glycosyltransferase family 2 protein [Elizabethkingia anophelis]MCT3630549.1 glycosyltransferase family 2 protein [Elizabethkingia anophelis]MCT3633942.1 glycosyltransferase family 2 protein [Elizabethkingia anophelis]MCT3774533.1 glycosyltransferase family 2 protein [Elizabethkingia anophelis]MCT3816445.1 glycosyltransferase family 2 protein [Elizabethkingia anophelis]MCT3830670.1 glycosyltransferase family 2 protein [Elizabethkingia anophelis]